jgi:hypothetical protein
MLSIGARHVVVGRLTNNCDKKHTAKHNTLSPSFFAAPATLGTAACADSARGRVKLIHSAQVILKHLSPFE